MDGVKTADIPEQTLDKLRRVNEYEFFPTSFLFLKGNMGLRPEKLHLLLGTTGSGKSTLTRAVLAEAAKECKVLCLLSEESYHDFCLSISYGQMPAHVRANILVKSELEMSGFEIKEVESYRQAIEMIINQHQPHAVFYDNLTTSSLYVDMTPGQQSQQIYWWKNLAAKKGFALFMVAHTKAGVSDNQGRLIEDSDIRGSKTPSNIAEYLYIFQRLRSADRFYPFVRVAKSRGHGHAGIFALNFDTQRRSYISDRKMPYKEFLETFNLRDKV